MSETIFDSIYANMQCKEFLIAEYLARSGGSRGRRGYRFQRLRRQQPDDHHQAVMATWQAGIVAVATLEAFVKPDLVAPGGHALGLISPGSQTRASSPRVSTRGLAPFVI